MSTTYTTIDALVPAVLAEKDRPARMDVLRANRQLLIEPVLFGVAHQATELAQAGESDRAQQAFTFGLEAAEAAEHLPAQLDVLLRLADFHEQAGRPPGAALDALERVCAVATTVRSCPKPAGLRDASTRAASSCTSSAT
jgi:hypothetical protein